MNIFKFVLAATVILCFMSSFSFAQDVTRSGPCKADIEKFCKKVKPGYGRVLRCMRQYDRYLSIDCVDHIGVVKEKTKRFVKTCKRDAQKFCNHAKAGQGEVYRCLRQHHESLTASCANQVK